MSELGTDISTIISNYDDQTFDPAVEQPAFYARQKIRDKISRDVADNESLLGTTADGAALAIYGVATLIKILNEHGSAAIKTAIQSAADGQLLPLADGFLTQIEGGTVKLPALEKGLESVVADIGERSTGVADVLAEMSGS